MAKKTLTLEHIDFSIGRWKTRLRRAMTAIDKLEKQRKRLVKAQASAPDLAIAPPLAKAILPVPVLLEKLDQLAPPKPAEWSAANPIEDDIPAFLRRQTSASPVAEQIKAEIEEKKKLKARGRIATMKAKQSGETRKMPLTGKAALQAIRG
jgi:hypothetical protein